MIRWLAVQVPELPVERLLAGTPAAEGAAVAVVAYGAHRDVVVASSKAARRGGVLAGMPAVAARALCAALEVRRHEPERDREHLERLAAFAGKWTPDVVLDGTRGLLLEVGRSAHLFGGEARLAEEAAARFETLGHEAYLGLAATPAAARALARAGGERVRRAEGEDPAPALRRLPLRAIDPPPEVLELALSLGITTVGGVLDLPRAGLAARCGDEALAVLDRLLGLRDEPLPRFEPPAVFDQRIGLWQPTGALDVLLFAAKRLLDPAEADLARRGHGLVEAMVELLPSEGTEVVRLPLRPPVPTAEARRLLRLLQHRLEATRLEAPVIGIRLRFESTAPLLLTQRALFDDRPAEQDLLENEAVVDLVSRLEARLGRERVLGAALVADHRPERAFRWRPPLAPGGDAGEAGGGEPVPPPAGRRPLEVHAEPEPLPVSADVEGRPVALLDGPERGPLRVLRGPERIEGGWWDGHDVRRAYFEVETALRTRLWLFRDDAGRGWLCHGAFL